MELDSHTPMHVVCSRSWIVINNMQWRLHAVLASIGIQDIERGVLYLQLLLARNSGNVSGDFSFRVQKEKEPCM